MKKTIGKLLIEAGCKKWEDTSNNQNIKMYDWVGRGTLLADGACVDSHYAKHAVPEKDRTNVYTTIEDVKLRAVSAMEGTMSVDFRLTMTWMDPLIRTEMTSNDEQKEDIVLGPDAIAEIWNPDTYILNRRSFTLDNEWASLKTAAILASDRFNLLESTSTVKNQTLKTTIELMYEIKSTVYCDFDLSTFPIDQQTCSLSFGSGSYGATFVLYDPTISYHGNTSMHAGNFEILITFFDEKINNGSNTVGFTIQMNRLIASFFLMYYVPCMAIVLACALSFVMPEYPEGRVALLVTLFLTLVNLLIYQMVCSLIKTFLQR